MIIQIIDIQYKAYMFMFDDNRNTYNMYLRNFKYE